ncbi:NTP transferase domain-containing protein [Patescibacteria group bacterium]|nr:NTP transferase domain-containing protein [Patescibacteria group bacterium]
MKGVILAGGTGSRLDPLTKVLNKHLIAVYNKPMIYFPIYTLKEAGITDILIVSGRGHSGTFLELLGSGSEFGLNFTYEIQEGAGGIAQALSLAKDFVGDDKFVVLLGDNVFEDNLTENIAKFKEQKSGARLCLKQVDDPKAYGVASVDGDKISKIVEKPAEPESNLAVLGLYMYDSAVFDYISKIEPSARNELEITDVNNLYLGSDNLEYDVIGGKWGDCGESFDSLFEASQMIKSTRLKNLDNNLNLL